MMIYRKHFYNFILILSIFAEKVIGANIFCIFPSASFSHQQPMLALSHALAAKGHNLTVITPNPSELILENHREININFMYEVFNEIQRKATLFNLQKPSDPYSIIRDLPELFEFLATTVLSSPQIQSLMRELKKKDTDYDLVIVESLYSSSFLGFVDILGNPPLIGITTAHTASKLDIDMGNPVIPSYMPHVMHEYSHQMNFWQRLDNLCLTLYFQFVLDVYNTPKQEVIMRKYFGETRYTAEEMEYNKSLLLVSADLATGYPKPINPNTIIVGPLHLQESQVLPQDIKLWMDKTEDGVIYFSLGGNMKSTSLSEDKIIAFIKAFSQFPRMGVLWKWEDDVKIPGQPHNVIVKKWVPQQAVLAHSKIKFFVTQCGLQSLQEAISQSVPVLCIPVFGDQNHNAHFIEKKGAGLTLRFEDVSHLSLRSKLRLLINNNRHYKNNMARLSLVSNDKPLSSIDTAIWWVEYVIRHNGAHHLRPASLSLQWYQYYMLDIAVLVAILIIVLLFLFYHTLKALVKIIFNKQVKSGKKYKDN